MSYIHEFPRLIHESDLDIFGHVNNARYLEILEEARWDLITQRGYGLDQVLKSKIGPTILEIHLKFTRELINRETVTVKSELLDYAGKAGRMRQQIVKADGVLACDAEFVIGLFDLNARRLIEPTPEWARVLGLT